MIEVISEYFYCLIYVIALTFTASYLLEEKVKFKRVVIMAPLYAIVNYLVAGATSNNFWEYMIVNSIIIVIDFCYICILFKKTNVIFYVSLFQLFYIFTVNSLIHVINIIIGFNREVTLSFSIQRLIMVFLINILTVIFIVVLDKLKIIPTQKVINRQVKLFIMLDILVYYAMVIIYNIGVVRLVNLITVLVLILLFLWIMFLKILSMYVETTIRNEELIMDDISKKYISKYLDFYNQESDNLRKLKHDLKNHQLVLESLDKKNQYTQYIDEVFKGIGQVAYIESGNIYIDACLYAKQQEYPEIIFDFDISVAGLVFNEKDLTSLIFNLIDNACNEALKHNKLVSVMIRYTNNLLIIRIKNTCPIKPNFSTDKGEGHGYGLKIIKNIVNKYHGDLFIDYHDDQVIFNIKINT